MGGSPPASFRRRPGKEGIPAPPGPWGCQPLGLVLVGPKNRNQASDNSGGPSGPSAPANPPSQVDDADFRCEFPGCNRTFPTNRGRGVHHQRAHKDWFDARLQPAVDKVRWTAEETAMLARKEAELTVESNPRFINQELLQYFPQRTLEAIKGKRRNQEYRELVEEFVEEFRNPDVITIEDDEEDEEDQRDIFLDYLESLTRPQGREFQATRLHNIAMEARTSGKDATLQKIALYLREVFPAPPPRRERRRKKTPNPAPMRKREARRCEYGAAQSLWKRDRRHCITNILNEMGPVNQPPRETMEPYWTRMMTTDGRTSPPSDKVPIKEDIWTPITGNDIKRSRIPRASAPGPDGISARLYRSIPTTVIIRLFNLLLWCERLPEDLLLSRTIFLPKKTNASEPGDFRPITIPPVLVRGLHKILAKRLETALDIDPRQRAFRSMDGCADNTLLLDTLLRYHRKQYKSLYMASIDVSKAFDAVTHPTIESTLISLGVPPPMIRYLGQVYANSRTRIEGDGWTSKPVHPKRGVRQGDPLSPILFNAVTHRLLQRLPREVGARLGNIPINAAAYADDLLLFASTSMGLQQMIDTMTDYLAECGMTINVEKSMTVAIRAAPHLKKTAVDASLSFSCGGRQLPSLKRTNKWRYLGVVFTPEGRAQCRPAEVVAPLLGALTKAPLKPQQRLYALRTVVIPKLYHQLALGAVTIGTLNKTDRLVRGALRKWLALPHDTPNAYFHTSVRDGGLGIPAIRWTAPVQRRGRLLGVMKALGQQGLDRFIQDELNTCKKRLTDHGVLLGTPEMVAKRWAQQLYGSIDGAGLKDSAKTPHQHQWIADGSKFLTGKDFINCNRARIGALPTRSRTTRGRPQDRRCRGGCLAQETLNHVLQHCHRTHGQRIKRHDAVVKYIARNMPRSGYEVHQEPHYKTELGLRKPDLVAVLGQTAIIIDAQVVSEQTNLDDAHTRKVAYYNEPATIRAIKAEHGVRTVKVTSATLSWKGVWSPRSAEELRKLGFIRAGDAKVVATRVLIGNIAAFRTFNATTSVEHRAGIG
ncbi:reverse transcriptase [Lasius niger]|uniref:Reverse transcriptase n=1 Tax=Lasius niger TaxID=67767 RepID=A0A0J7N6L9_LASNI|nr:reverse transcriptase [Lasius niger]